MLLRDPDKIFAVFVQKQMITVERNTFSSTFISVYSVKIMGNPFYMLPDSHAEYKKFIFTLVKEELLKNAFSKNSHSLE